MKLYLLSLGCDKNLVDAEHMLSLFLETGKYELLADPGEAEVIVVNTCCFIGDAKEESINAILELADYKETGSAKALIVTGCLAQRYKEEIRREIPEVDAVVGTTSWDRLPLIAEQVLGGEKKELFSDIDRPPFRGKRVLTSPGLYSASLKIAEGCDKNCTYCIIPKVRGHYRSVPIEDLVSEAEFLAASGIRELCLVAQETTLYGKDLYGKKSLPVLLDRLNAIEGLKWIRILYCYPEEIDEELIDSICRNEKVCHYLDLPIQHASDRILKAMGRKTRKAELLQVLERLRSRIPDIVLRTTLISGFPGETEAEHEELLSFVKEAEFDRLGCFAYSPEEGTAAFELPGQIPEEEKERRAAAVLAAARIVSHKKNEQRIGKTETVLVEGRLPEEEVYVGRSYRDAPDIDDLVFFPADRELISGEFCRVRILSTDDYDVTGELTDESSE